MGTIDKSTYTLTCEECSISESASVSDKGSGWSGSDWRSSASFSKFNTEWTGGGKVEPSITSASCNACGSALNIESKYGG